MHVVLDALRDHVVAQLPEALVGVRNRLDHHVQGRAGRDDGDHQDRAQQPVRADAAGQERHELAVGGQASEADQETDQERHRDREAERLRDQRQQHPAGDRPRHALRHQRLELVHHRREHEEEREDQERQEQRREDFPDDVAVDGAEHRVDSENSTGAAALARRPQTVHRPLFLGILAGSDNGCYVN